MRQFADERLWATNRRMWRLRMWWDRVKVPFLCFLIILIWGLATWLDERDLRRNEQGRRVHAEAQRDIATAVYKTECYNVKRPTSMILVGDSIATLDLALAQAANQADKQRLSWRGEVK